MCHVEPGRLTLGFVLLPISYCPDIPWGIQALAVFPLHPPINKHIKNHLVPLLEEFSVSLFC